MRSKTLIVASLLLSACTVGIWQEQFYNEKIAGFYVSKKENILIGIGETYSYFFKINNPLVEILTAKTRNKLKQEIN